MIQVILLEDGYLPIFISPEGNKRSCIPVGWREAPTEEALLADAVVASVRPQDSNHTSIVVFRQAPWCNPMGVWAASYGATCYPCKMTLDPLQKAAELPPALLRLQEMLQD